MLQNTKCKQFNTLHKHIYFHSSFIGERKREGEREREEEGEIERKRER